MTATALIREVNGLRTAQFHLTSQIEAGVDTPRATLDQARAVLKGVEKRLSRSEAKARELPEAAYLFKRSRRRTGRTRVPSSQSVEVPQRKKEATMARKSNAQVLENTLVALRRAEKSAGSTKWALSGKGAEKNPPSPERAKALAAKLGKEQALVAELRAKRDELKTK